MKRNLKASSEAELQDQIAKAEKDGWKKDGEAVYEKLGKIIVCYRQAMIKY